MIRRCVRAQSSVEYVILIIIILAAYLAISQYIKRGFQGRWKATVDDFGDQYDPRLVSSITNYTMSASSNTVITTSPDTTNPLGPGYYTNRVDQSYSKEEKHGTSNVGVFDPNGLPVVPTDLGTK